MYMSFGTGSARPGATALALGSALALGLLAGACFNPPAGAVNFACDPADDAAACPDGYECRDDGCCHRAGSEGDDGACKLGVASISAGGAGSSGGGTGTTGATGTDSVTGGPESTGSGGTGDDDTTSATTSSGSTSSSSTASTGPQTTG